MAGKAIKNHLISRLDTSVVEDVRYLASLRAIGLFVLRGLALSAFVIMGSVTGIRKNEPMPSRSYWIPAVVLWFTAMGWLFSTKILPTFLDGQPPSYEELLPKTEITVPQPVRWAIRWNGTEIGWAENKITRSSDGTGKIASECSSGKCPSMTCCKTW